MDQLAHDKLHWAGALDIFSTKKLSDFWILYSLDLLDFSFFSFDFFFWTFALVFVIEQKPASNALGRGSLFGRGRGEGGFFGSTPLRAS